MIIFIAASGSTGAPSSSTTKRARNPMISRLVLKPSSAWITSPMVRVLELILSLIVIQSHTFYVLGLAEAEGESDGLTERDGEAEADGEVEAEGVRLAISFTTRKSTNFPAVLL